jgi:hypothetical protein
MSKDQDLRDQWAAGLSDIALTFADGRQTYPNNRNKKHGGNLPPSTTTKPPKTQDKTIMSDQTLTIESTNGKGKVSANTKKAKATIDLSKLTTKELAKKMDALTAQFEQSQKLSSRAIDVAVIATGVAVGVGAALTVHHFVTKQQ